MKGGREKIRKRATRDKLRRKTKSKKSAGKGVE